MDELKESIRKMDLPEHRRRPCNNEGLRWLARCLHQRNRSHPMFTKAVEALRALGHEVVLE